MNAENVAYFDSFVVEHIPKKSRKFVRYKIDKVMKRKSIVMFAINVETLIYYIFKKT